MEVVHTFLKQSDEIYAPFAYEEVSAREMGADGRNKPLLHIWRHERALVLGLRDRLLPGAKEAMRQLEHEGIRVMVRNSGGAAVPLDAGVVNISVIRPMESGAFEIHDDFRWMAQYVQETLSPYDITFDIGEIEGSYCPGEFDLSISGKKFCGLAQRRTLKAFSVQAFVNAEGDSSERAEIARRFYQLAGGEACGEGSGVLNVRSETMGSLSELHPEFPGAEAWLRLLTETPYADALVYDQPSVSEMVTTLKSRYDPRWRNS